MTQIILNHLSLWVLPILAGFTVRFLLRRMKHGYLVTIAFAVATLAAWIAAGTIPSHGSELYSLQAVQAANLFAASLLTGLTLRKKK